MKILLALLFSLVLLAESSLLERYQQDGIISIEKVFDKTLSSEEYWSKKLQNKDTRFGYFEGIDYILACNKQEKSLKLYTKDKNNTFKLNVEFYAFVGEKEGDKYKEGDLKTPVGVYKLLQRLDKVDSFYGPLAFVTSYPNTFDKVQGKNGSGIWLHGLPLHQERDDYTKGCIAINNTNIEDIKEKINFKKTIVYINKGNYPQLKQEDFPKILANLFQWREAWKYSDVDTYLDFYNADFKRHDGMKFLEYKKYKKRVFAKNETKQITFSEINIIPYPKEDKKGLFLISFNEEYVSPSYQFSGEKELYIQFIDGHITILAEK